MRKAKSEKQKSRQKNREGQPVHQQAVASAHRKQSRPHLVPGSSLTDDSHNGPSPQNEPFDPTEKAKELIRLAKEQGHLTYDDVNDALSEHVVTPDDLDRVLTKLRNLEIDIIDPAEVDRG